MRCLCACSVFVQWSRPRSCHSRVARALCLSVHVRGAVSRELCVCGVFFACGGLTSVEHWECPRLWRVGRGSVVVFVCVCSGFCSWAVYTVDVRGGVCIVFGVSVCVSPLIRHDGEVATHSSCSAKSSHFVRLVPQVWMLRLVRLVRLVRLDGLVATRINADVSLNCHSIDG